MTAAEIEDVARKSPYKGKVARDAISMECRAPDAISLLDQLAADISCDLECWEPEPDVGTALRHISDLIDIVRDIAKRGS